MSIPWDLIATVVIAVISSSWFANLINNRSRYSNKHIIDLVESQAADISRRRILNFNSEILKHEKHTQEDFNDVLLDIDKYDEFCKSHPEYPNSRAVLAEKNIKNTYKKCLKDNDFL